MPYYAWRGSDQAKRDKYGTSYARDINQLDRDLSSKGITLFVARESYLKRKKSISRTSTGHMSEYMHGLLQSGLKLDESLYLCSKTVNHELLRAILIDASGAIREGMSLSVIFEKHVPWIDSLLVSLIKAGEESSSLIKTFKMLHIHYKTQEDLAAKLRAALLMPCITVFFFFVIAIGIFVSVIPRFESLFKMLNKPIPNTTYYLFAVSKFVQSTNFLFMVALALSLGLFSFYYLQRGAAKEWRDSIILSVPVIGRIVRLYSLTLFLQTLAVLLEGEVHLVKAIDLASKTVNNEYIRSGLRKVCQDVETGVPLNQAFSRHIYPHAEDIESLCLIGESSGTLDVMIGKAAQLYHDKTYSALSVTTTLIPPILLILLGIVIGILIFSVYTPLLTLSRVI